ncbi:MAG: hypothetical protein Q8M29_01005 [Bacteroidota bacterium]|nr:hypothetical protein [Bacteroidota bacterium]
MTYADIVSSIGVTCILTAFFLATLKLLKADTKTFFLFNIIGGALACYGSILIHSIPFTILEGMWAVVAIVGLIKTITPKVSR